MKAAAFVQILLLSLLASLASAQPVNDGYALDASGRVVKNPFGLCWHTINWTAAKAIAECDPDLVKPAPKAEAPAPVVRAAPAPEPAPEPKAAPAPIVAAPIPAPAPAPAPVARRQAITLGADAAFDTGKADLKPDGRAKLNELAVKLRDVNFDSIAVTGYTDSIGSNAANQRLSQRRADAVKQYLVSQGVEAKKIQTTGRGEANPVADNKSAQGRARNRRVEVEINGTRSF